VDDVIDQEEIEEKEKIVTANNYDNWNIASNQYVSKFTLVTE